ncbi:MAG: hypothetical protein AB1418_02465 [Pseudomonadota bacterium]
MKPLIPSLAAALSLAAVLGVSPALAGGGHGPQHGGVVREVRHITYELVAKPDALTLYVSDHGKPISTQGATGEAVIYAGNDKTTVKLEPAGGNRMAAQGSFKVGVGVRVTVTFTFANGSSAKTVFNLK